ncbi:MAG: choice-of-anchor Q domain-containing protein [Verrucomicrobiia bacterium]
MNARQISALRFLVGRISIAAACLVLSGAAPASLSAATITVTSTNDNGPGTLRDVLASAANGDVINFSLTTPATIRLTSGELLVTNSVTIAGPSPANLAVNGNSIYRVFYIGSNATVTIGGMMITQSGYLNGGGIWNDHATLTVTNCTLSSNSGGSAGGGIYNTGSLTVTASTLSGNSAGASSGGNGGGIYSSGNLTVSASVISGNLAYALSGSQAYGWGGGIFNLATITVTNSSFSDNAAGYVGGGIVNFGGTGTVSVSTLSSNLSQWAGGIDNYISGLLTVINCTVSSNSASYGGGGGGGIDNEEATMTVINCTLNYNSTSDDGGGIINFGTLTVSASTLSGNAAANGGGIYSSNSLAVLTVSNSTISGNSASGQGGGILTTNGTLTVMACTLSGNSALNGGGGIMNAGSSAHMQIGNTILNAGDSGENITNALGTLVSRGYNLSSDAAGGDDHGTGPGGLLNGTNDIRNTDPMLAPQASNGGPTFTQALLPGSPATCQGYSFGLTTDQRGLPRTVVDPCITNPPGGDGSDIGAFQVQQTCRSVVFDITAIERIGTGNDLRLSYATVLGSNYVVQTRSNMVTGSWTSLPGTNTGIGVVMQYIVTNALVAPQGFYRIQQLP